MIIDMHCHAGQGDGLTGPWDTDAPLTAYLSRAHAAGITHSVVFAAFSSDYAQANDHVARLVHSRPGRLSGFCFVHAERDRGRIAELVRSSVLDHGFVGIKLHRQDAPITREVCEVAQRFSLPVLYDVMGDVAPIELFASQYPRVSFIIPHLGSFADDWRAHLGLVDMLQRHRNVFTDSAGVRRFDWLQHCVKRVGAHKLLFGSDGPWLHPALELEKIRLLELPVTEERLVLSGNFLRLTARVRHCLRRRRESALAATELYSRSHRSNASMHAAAAAHGQ